MSHAMCLQDWISTSGNANAVMTQSVDGYLDLSLYQDAAFYVEIAGISGSPTLKIQGSPTKDESFWAVLLDASGVGVQYTAAGLQPLKLIKFLDAALPIARWMRWTITSGTAWSASFRIWVSLNQARGGMLLSGGQQLLEPSGRVIIPSVGPGQRPSRGGPTFFR